MRKTHPRETTWTIYHYRKNRENDFKKCNKRLFPFEGKRNIIKFSTSYIYLQNKFLPSLSSRRVRFFFISLLE